MHVACPTDQELHILTDHWYVEKTETILAMYLEIHVFPILFLQTDGRLF